jgi:hypothetical protein
MKFKPGFNPFEIILRQLAQTTCFGSGSSAEVRKSRSGITLNKIYSTDTILNERIAGNKMFCCQKVR